MGPRQVGKTTMVTQLLKKKLIPYHMSSADAVPVSNRTQLEQQWETARLMMDQQEAKEFSLVIDKIQKIDNWSETVKLLWDTDINNGRQLKVILLGHPACIYNRVLLNHWQDALSSNMQGIGH